MHRMNRWTQRVLGIVAGLTLVLPSVLADEPASAPADKDNPHQWQPKATSVAVFKNGLGFFMREGEVALRDGWCLSKEVPPAAFGTLMIYSHAADQVVDIVGSGPGEVVEFDGVDAAKDADTKRKRLDACANLNLQLIYKQENANRTATGKVRGVEGKFVILESESNNFAVPLAAITRLQVLDLPIRVHVKGEKDAPKRAKLGMAYLRKGVTWIPEYTLKVIDKDSAELTLRGTFVNEAEDLIHCDVNFVVGVPHFVHTDYLAPIAVGQTIRTIGAAVAPAQIQSQMMQRAAIVTNVAPRSFEVVEQPVETGSGNIAATVGNLPQMAGAAATDYTVYTMKDLTVRRGEKAIVTLFRKTIKYTHVYRWTPPEAMRHLLVLQNATDTAWTTGPCLAVSGNQPLGEDLLKYTPKGGAAELPVTAAINISHDKNEAEIDRKLKAHSPSQNVYLDLVTLKGEISLKNFEKEPVRLVITVPVPGKPVEATDDGITAGDPDKLRLLERAGTITWNLKLEPDEKKKLTYTYDRYVPSQ